MTSRSIFSPGRDAIKPSAVPQGMGREYVSRGFFVAALVALLAACASAPLTLKTQDHGDQKHVVARYRGKTPPDELLWEVCQWRTREPVQATDHAFEADFSCVDGGSARVTLFRADHAIASASSERRPSIAGAEWR